MNAETLIETLLVYALRRLGAEARDERYLRNRLLARFGLIETSAPTVEEIPELPELYRETAAYGEATGTDGDRFATAVFGDLTPMPSCVEERFRTIERTEGSRAACLWLYDLCSSNGYIRTWDIARNLKWKTDGAVPLEITINLSKPEKNNRDVAAALKAKPSSYPNCLLCPENEGYAGTPTHPARGNLRTAALTLGGERWYMQYSPYLYYDEHCIVFNERHVPMKVDGTTVPKLLDFVDRFPDYFLGSNAALPRVGGSILTHEHFQGGGHVMPMHTAGIRKRYAAKDFPTLRIGVLDWLNSVVRIETEDRAEAEAAAFRIVGAWDGFSAPEVGILAETEGERHNALSPIARKSGKKYLVDFVLRNNRANERYPEGIFHAHPEHHAIKHEAIGLIEAMGLFILPARLKRELSDAAQAIADGVSEGPHAAMISELIPKTARGDLAGAERAVKTYVERTCREILKNTAVFKEDPAGVVAFDAFLRGCGFEEVTA